MQDDRASKTPLWRQPVLWAAGAAVLLVVGGVGWMIYSAEELDEQLDRQAAVADAPGRQAELEQAYIESVAEDARAREVQSSGNSSPVRRDADEASSAAPPSAPEGDLPTAPSDAKSTERTESDLSPNSSVPLAVPTQESFASKPAEPAANTPASGSPSADSPPSAKTSTASPRDWLRINENGEPYEVTLADGAVLKLDTYGDSYQGYRAIAPVDGVKKAAVVVDYQRDRLGGGIGAYFLQLDVANRKMYWIESGGGGLSRIRSANLSGRNPRVVLDLRFQNAQALAIDSKRRKLYWANHAPGDHPAFGAPPDAAQAVWEANLDGSKPHPLFTALSHLGAVGVEPQSGKVFYFAGPRLACGESDGTHGTAVIESLDKPNPFSNVGVVRYKGFNAAIDPKGGKIYWCANQGYIARANLDGSAFEVVSDGVVQIEGLGIDVPNGKLYWAAGPRMGVWRANADGSQPEMVAEGMETSTSIGIDSERGHVYWTDLKISGVDKYALIRRLDLPPPPRSKTTPAPPWINSINPSRQRAGGKMTIRGAQFIGVTHVRVIGDDGRQLEAKFDVVNDREVTFILPQRRKGVTRAAIVVEGAGGVTVTLSRDASFIKPDDRGITTFDRITNDGFCFVVSPGQGFHNVEHSLVFVPKGAVAMAGGRGNDVGR